ncbi:hypothetical protein B0H14DRAFT_2580920 [Mycena olivaceomarginata]|nr:hypothetical protein B0H14DRAFT_2580920 [Mycena olivaceomarginata]
MSMAPFGTPPKSNSTLTSMTSTLFPVHLPPVRASSTRQIAPIFTCGKPVGIAMHRTSSDGSPSTNHNGEGSSIRSQTWISPQNAADTSTQGDIASVGPPIDYPTRFTVEFPDCRGHIFGANPGRRERGNEGKLYYNEGPCEKQAGT